MYAVVHLNKLTIADCPSGMNEWVPGWMNKNWRTKEGKEPENIDLIKLVHFRANNRPAKVEVIP